MHLSKTECDKILTQLQPVEIQTTRIEIWVYNNADITSTNLVKPTKESHFIHYKAHPS